MGTLEMYGTLGGAFRACKAASWLTFLCGKWRLHLLCEFTNRVFAKKRLEFVGFFCENNLNQRFLNTVSPRRKRRGLGGSAVRICGQLSFLSARQRQTTAASAPPTSGATMNTHTFSSAVPPRNSAGPNDLAGFTLVPVK